MRTLFSIAAIGMALAASAFGQSVFTDGSRSSIVNTSLATTATWFVNGNGTISMAGHGDIIYGIPTENRKDDGKGITLAQLKLAATPWNSLRLAPQTYVARAQKIGLSSAGTDEARMLQAIHDAQLHTFPYAKVDDYLYRKALRQGANFRWVWTPIRDSDVKAAGAYGQTASGYVAGGQYSREIPDRILADIERLMDCAPEDTIFLASDYRVVNPDPFLAVTTPKMLAAGIIYIVDCWDEPGFTEKGEPDSGVTLSASLK